MLLAKVQPLKDQSVTDSDCASGQLSIWDSLKMKWRNHAGDVILAIQPLAATAPPNGMAAAWIS